MKKYNSSIPLVSLHIPKCSGTSLLRALEAGHHDGAYNLINYYPDIGDKLPSPMPSGKTIVHGHFVRWKDASVEDVLPNTNQYITIVRDPIDALVSGYWYGFNKGFDWATKQSIESFLLWHINNKISPIFGALQLLTDYADPAAIAKEYLIIKTADQVGVFIEELSDMISYVLPKIEYHNVTEKYSKKISAELINKMQICYADEINLVRYLGGQCYY